MSNREKYFAAQYSNFSSHDQITIAAKHLLTARNEGDQAFATFLEANLRRHRVRAQNQPLDGAIEDLTAFAVSKDPKTLDPNDLKLVAASVRMVACAMQARPDLRPQLEQVLRRFGKTADSDSAAKLAAFHISRSAVDREVWSSIDIELFASSESAILNEEARAKRLSLEEINTRHNYLLGEVPDYISEHFFYADNMMYLHQTGDTDVPAELVLASYTKTVSEAIRLSNDPNLQESQFVNLQNITAKMLYSLAVPASSPLPLAIETLRNARELIRSDKSELPNSTVNLKDNVSFATIA